MASKGSFSVSVRLTRHNLSAREAESFRDAAEHAFQFLAGRSKEASAGGASKRKPPRDDEAMSGAAARLVAFMVEAAAASSAKGSGANPGTASWGEI